MSEPKTIRVNEVDYVRADSVKPPVVEGDHVNPYWKTGRVYFVETVTQYFTGLLEWYGKNEIVFTSVCWIAHTGRFNEFLKDKSAVDETEPYPPELPVSIGRGALICMVEYKPGLILEVK